MNLAIVIPCYNEEEVIRDTEEKIRGLLKTMVSSGEVDSGCILYVDDGSSDRTWDEICDMKQQNSDGATGLYALKLAANSGHQNALMAGLRWAYDHEYDATISIDADLQDDINCIPQMVKLAHAGSEIVYGVRESRDTDGIFKRITAQMFYSLLRQLGCNTIYNHGDFRLMSHKALKALMEYPERNLFLRGMIKNIGLPFSIVYYERKKRMAGVTKYPFLKMLSFAVDGITSFSVKPLHIITLLGVVCIIVAVVLIIYSIYRYLAGETQPGWTSMMTSIWFVGGMNITALGVVGEYTGKIYKEVKRRPRYFVEEEI